MSLSRYVTKLELEYLRGFQMPSAPGGRFVGLFTGDPTDTGTEANEVTQVIRPTGRPQVSFSDPVSTITETRMVSSSPVIFGESAGNAGVVSHWGVFDAANGGNLLFHGSTVSLNVTTGIDVFVDPGDLQIFSSTPGGTSYAKRLRYRWIQGFNEYPDRSTINFYATLWSGDPGMTGLLGAEVLSVLTGSPNRLPLSFLSPTDDTTGSTIVVDGALSFTTSALAQQTVSHWAIVDTQSTPIDQISSNIWYRGTLNNGVPRTVPVGGRLVLGNGSAKLRIQ